MRALAALLLVLPAAASAVPGPDTTAILANAAIPESVLLAQTYAAARDVPARRVCALDLPQQDDITLAEFRTLLLEPLRSCLEATGALERIEAVVVMRGVPLRVVIPTGAPWGDQRASLAAVLGAWESETLDGKPLIGESPGTSVNCGAPCFGAKWANPFRDGVFEPGWQRDLQGVHWRPVLVTRLDGRTYEDAAGLIDAAIEAEAPGGATGEFMLMGGADPARAALDWEYDAVAGELEARGAAVALVPFARDLTGHTLAGFATGTAGLGQTIEGNAYVRGAIVDNLTSFGALPENFTADGESQVSIARWVRAGVAGVHGTTDEPLSNVFPSRWFLVDYADGYTLAESYLRRMPAAYWRNLVIGDAMAAPYAVRPEVKLEVGACRDGLRRVKVTTTDPEGSGVNAIRLLVEGVEVASGDSDALDAAVPIPDRAVQVLAVAQKAVGAELRSLARPKGWASVTSDGARCVEAQPEPDPGGLCGAGAPLPGALALLGLARRRLARRRR